MYPWHLEQYWAHSRYSIIESALMKIKHYKMRSEGSEGFFFIRFIKKIKIYCFSSIRKTKIKNFMVHRGNVDTHKHCWRGAGPLRTVVHFVHCSKAMSLEREGKPSRCFAVERWVSSGKDVFL